MTAQEMAYVEVEKLVKGFKALPAAQRKSMKEMQTRLGYILPLFKAPGWDTSNINEVSPAEKSTHDEIVKPVEKMLAQQKERQSTRPEDEHDRVRNLERQIAEVDAEIDQQVYVLYGLSEEEIKIVER